jgi:hypothetical protein
LLLVAAALIQIVGHRYYVPGVGNASISIIQIYRI